MTVSPKLINGGIVTLDAAGTVLRVIALQYNPDTLTRSMQVQATDTGGTDRSEALRLKGPAVETVNLDTELDLTDALEHPGTNPGAGQVGLHPQLAALEGLINPTTATLSTNDMLARAGTLEIIPMQTPLTLFVWSRHRIVPVRITQLTITEEAFDAALNPIRAKVTLGMRILTVNDLGFDHPGGAIFLTYLRTAEQLADRSQGTLGQLGITAIG
ncbi:hypothetical protein ACFW9U_26760 [Rhodococcus aetherivorans]|uniref:hypothetical protein n=1 Tax=Rhodococcus aetherivorans TaxID=191292 RepID=UPI003672D12F